MRRVTVEELAALEAESKVFSRLRDGPKTFVRPNGHVYKVVDSRWHWRPSGPIRKALRFRHNAQRLSARGIRCPEVLEILAVTGRRQHVIVYRMLPGEAVREALPRAQRPTALRSDLAAFVARLHDAGVFFKAGHLGNYLVQTDGVLALIDLQDVWISLFNLSAVHRARSFRILMKYAGDRELLDDNGALGSFVANYLGHARLGALQRWVFMALIPFYVPMLRGARFPRQQAPQYNDAN